MPSFQVTGASGEGLAQIDAGNSHLVISVAVFNVQVTFPTAAREIYNQLPKFIKFGGQVMLGLAGAGSPLVFWSSPVRWQPGENHVLDTQVTIDSVMWKLPPGITANISVTW